MTTCESPSTQLPPQKSGIRSALEYTGIPASWLTKRPKLPSRNWLIFISVTSSVAGLYIYDRQQCKRIRRDYIDRVAHIAEQRLGHLDWPRRVTVYGCKWPGDEDYDRSLKYFRKYVKPILVAAAVDFEQINGKRHGDLANRIADEIKARRRLAAGLDPRPPVSPVHWMSKSPEETRKYELAGGIIIVGRHTLKEFLAGLKKGWTNSLEKLDQDELLARELEVDGNFDEPEEPSTEVAHGGDNLASSVSHLPSSKNSPVFSPLQSVRQSVPPRRNQQPSSTISASSNTPPTVIPSQPPLLLVQFTNYIGFTQIPTMIWDFFNQRHKVRSGAEAAYKLIMKNTRPFIGPSFPSFDSTTPVQLTEDSDLDFDQKAEKFYKSSTSAIPADLEKAREKYYDALPAKLETARAISRGTREMTKDEMDHPPPTEVELRAERMKKERRWRTDLEGWGIVKPEKDAVWDERFADALRVFDDPCPGLD